MWRTTPSLVRQGRLPGLRHRQSVGNDSVLPVHGFKLDCYTNPLTLPAVLRFGIIRKESAFRSDSRQTPLEKPPTAAATRPLGHTKRICDAKNQWELCPGMQYVLRRTERIVIGPQTRSKKEEFMRILSRHTLTLVLTILA